MSYDTNALTLNGQPPTFYSGGQLPGTSAVKIANYTASATDCVVLCNATSGAFTVTLPVTGITSGKVYNVKTTVISINAVTISVSGGAQIDGLTTKVLSVITLVNIQLVFDGTNYWII